MNAFTTSCAPPHPDPYMMSGSSWSSLVEDQGWPTPRRVWERLSRPTRERPEGSIGSGPGEDRYKANRLFTLSGFPRHTREEGPVRNYIGVDWADEEDAVWVVNDAGDKVLSRRVAHTVAVS